MVTTQLTSCAAFYNHLAEVIHLGHNRSVAEIVDCAIAEDAQVLQLHLTKVGMSNSSNTCSTYSKSERKYKLFGGGGGTILPSEIEELHDYGIAYTHRMTVVPLDYKV